MRFFESHGARVVVLDSGDEVIATLQRFASEHVTTSAFFHGLGAFREATVAWWNPESLQYEDIAVNEQVEVLSMNGNLTRVAHALTGGFKVHAHTVLGKRGGATIGGHVKRGVVHPTLELYLAITDDAIHRERDEATALDLIR
jgi:predicted DNA-binding protein with PD1-like motif